MVDAQRLKAELERWPSVRLAVLFGSQALGRSTSASDVDIGVLLEPTDAVAFEQLFRALSVVAGRAVDLIDLRTAPPLLRLEIARAGTLLIERAPHAWADFKAHAMIDWGDWAPYARRIAAASARRNEERLRDGQA